MLLLERHTAGVHIKGEFSSLSAKVQTVGLVTMEGINKQIYDGIIQQEQGETGNGRH